MVKHLPIKTDELQCMANISACMANISAERSTSSIRKLAVSPNFNSERQLRQDRDRIFSSNFYRIGVS